ncbi:MAG: SDR family oxidoreductase [Rhodospirillaceae bacterium]|nr:SDR family oxidoreductase [Rhodospirillaceae bacterium]
MFNLKGRRALITGASSGIGKHFAKVLAQHGATVVIAARRKDKLDDTAAAIRSAGGTVAVVEMDVSNGKSIVAGVDAAEQAVGLIDILVNNAGIIGTKSAVDMPEEEWDAVLETNLRGSWLCAREIAKRLIAAKAPGAVLNVASVLGLMTQKGTAPYAASKAGLIHLTRVLASEWMKHGIRVNSLAPGYIATDMADGFFTTSHGQKILQTIPMRRVGTVDDLTAPMLLLVSDASAYMSGSVITIDGGLSLGN